MDKLIHGDCIKELRKLENNSVDLLCTDPPYGYSFMGKNWDRAVPSVEIWKECLRVLKPGAFAFVMSAPRQDVLSQMIVRIGEAGFDTDFTSIYWTYASGFPKAANIGKMVDKRLGTYVEGKPNRNARFANQPVDGDYNHSKVTREFTAQSVEAKTLDGSYGGFQPKPAVEVIIVAMKPLSERTFVDQALENGKGVTWLDDCRVPFESEAIRDAKVAWGEKYRGRDYSECNTSYKIPQGAMSQKGRFPGNLLVSDDVLNDGRITKGTEAPRHNNRPKTAAYGVYKPDVTGGYADMGSYSRYFDLDAWAKTFPFLIVPKASKREKNEGLENTEGRYMDSGRKVGSAGGTNPRNRGAESKRQNFHPTVKPLKLMSYLITLGSRPNDVVLDPFLGSGTTAIAATMLDRRYIGIEREHEYVDIARARIKAVRAPQRKLIAAE